MPTPAELLHELEDTISSPAGAAIHEYVLRGDREGALRLIQDERFSRENAEIIYDYCREVWGGVDVDLVEIPLALAAETFEKLAAAAGDDEYKQPRYLIRDGTNLSYTSAYLERGEWHVFLSKKGFVPFSRIRQLWHVQPKAV